MTAVKAYYDGNVFIPIEPVRARKNQNAIITILDVEHRKDKPHRDFIGIMSQESFDEICLALLDTQRVDANEW